jgi:hypothetical protein
MSDDDIKKEENGNDLALEKKRWQNRRRMAWISLSSMILMTALILFTNLVPNEKLKILSEVITWYYLTCASVVGAYMGFTTYASIKGK